MDKDGRTRERGDAMLADRLAALFPAGKRLYVQRLARRLTEAVLEAQITSWDRVHIPALRSSMDLSRLPDPQLRRAVSTLMAGLVRGEVIPVQEVERMVDESRAWYLGKCICRQAGRVTDGPIEPAAARESTALRTRALTDLVEAWRAEPRGGTAQGVHDWMEATAAAPDPESGIRIWWERSSPYLELLFDHPSITPTWRRSLEKNRKLVRLGPGLARAWARFAWVTREVIFTRMIANRVDYAICSCPGPERDMGCLLTNWRFGCGVPSALLPNEDGDHGRRRGDDGSPLTCQHHPTRTECLGCGCSHD